MLKLLSSLNPRMTGDKGDTEDCTVHGCALHLCRDALNWKTNSSTSPPTVFDRVHMRASPGIKQILECESWPAKEREGRKQSCPGTVPVLVTRVFLWLKSHKLSQFFFHIWHWLLWRKYCVQLETETLISTSDDTTIKWDTTLREHLRCFTGTTDLRVVCPYPLP